MSEQLFDIKVRYVFEGTYTVSANSREEAKDKIRRDCGLVMGGDIHTTLDEQEVEWEFPLHPVGRKTAGRLGRMVGEYGYPDKGAYYRLPTDRFLSRKRVSGIYGYLQRMLE